MPLQKRKGRRRQACDRCALYKSACDREKPCRTCLDSGVNCTFFRLKDYNRPDEVSNKHPSSRKVQEVPEPISPANTPVSSPSTVLDTIAMTPKAIESVPLPFLLSFATSNTHRSIPYTFGFSTSPPEALPELASLFDDVNPDEDSQAEKTNASSLLNSWTQAEDNLNVSKKAFSTSEQDASSHSAWSCNPSENPVSTYTSWGFEDLDNFMAGPISCNDALKQGFNAQATASSSEIESRQSFAPESFVWPCQDDTFSIQSRLEEISTQLKCYCMSLPQEHFASTKNVKINLAGWLFKVVNLQTALPVYFHHFHRHCPAVHPATFKPQSVSTQLLLAVFLAGTFYSSSQAQLDIARNYLDLVEEFVQNCSSFTEMLTGNLRDSEAAQREYIEILQAAIIIYMLQDNEGTQEAQGRLRAQSFPKLIKVGSNTALLNEDC